MGTRRVPRSSGTRRPNGVTYGNIRDNNMLVQRVSLGQPTNILGMGYKRHRKFCSQTRTQHVLQQVLDA